MQRVKKGDTVVISYHGRLEDGTVFDSTEDRNPLEVTLGEGELIPGLEQGILGMTLGESKTIVVPEELGYGPHLKERVCELDKKRIPEGFQPEIGHQMQLYRADGLPVMGTVIGEAETSFTMDYNHPLAGKTLIFETRVLDIVTELPREVTE
ncbi:MAG TPA: FKBP-type peptidyl-prolyl cis-trans isomerase [Thermodesulfovibrionales bacterium]|nr:FKBP-type peptidyl-prolyl cis-trans isomerase [Thermodesulfovibrionales bacterium]